MPEDPTAPAEARQIAYELLVQITFGKQDTILLPAETDTIEVSLCDDDGRQRASEALPPDLKVVLLMGRRLARWPPPRPGMNGKVREATEQIEQSVARILGGVSGRIALLDAAHIVVIESLLM